MTNGGGVRILQVHNSYQHRGGEDTVVAAEAALLRQKGHEVEQFIVSNDQITGLQPKISAALSLAYSPRSREQLKGKLSSFRPEIVHFHNLFPLLTPSVYDACWEARVPVVQTLHNYRLGCINGMLVRDGVVCEKCWTGSPLWGVLHRCYRDSALGSAAVALALSRQHTSKAYQTKVDRFIALTEFAKRKFVDLGLPEHRVVVKANFAADQEGDLPLSEARHGALFVGRLSDEKGVRDLVEAWREIDYPLTIVGGGPLERSLRAISPPHVRYTGFAPPDEVRLMMKRSAFLVFPSRWYEGLPMVIVEAFACGLPVLGTALGGAAELLANGEGGWLFPPRSVLELQRLVRNILADPDALSKVRLSARQLFERRFSPTVNYHQLMAIYADAKTEFERAGGLKC
ncbi:glycosyltransferase family 4 protein [Bradyrhizobium manausense]|uniref:glycosyltransferase family 4 protein n=1 Tax=Bradyrhizobium manausense TaxID=989370 RepID=UPI001BA50E8F|nr:glycosyltransferase family 4 protein [Bradyrhizobium manausense]MBR0829854.1 glycosyltransferase family 4 protein [Bradyrhizobium manausense]